MTANNMKPQGRRRTGPPSLRGLQGRSATGQNGQAAKEELSAIWGAGCRKNNSGVPAGRSVFHLTSPFIGLFPALKRWAKLGRPSGTAFSCAWFHQTVRKRVLTHTLKRCSTQNQVQQDRKSTRLNS